MSLISFISGRTCGELVPGINVLTYHNDNARTGQNLNETILTLANVNTHSFGRLLAWPVEGDIFAQPLYVSGVPVPGLGIRNLAIAVTEEDSVYAFDADGLGGTSAGPIWHDKFIDPAAGITSVPLNDVGLAYPLGMGITGTPVIDPQTMTVYVVAKTKEANSVATVYMHRLHALDLATGAEKFGGPVALNASVFGQGDGSDGTSIPFDNLHQLERCGLLLQNGVVYIAFASAGDVPPYHGWILGYDAQTLQLVETFNDTPQGGDGGIWMSGGAPATDVNGNIYCLTGNGLFDADTGGANYGDTILKLAASGTNLVVQDFFTPFDQEALDQGDGDLGSGGALLLPDNLGSPTHPHLLLGAGKEGTIYVVDRDNMGQFNSINDSQIVQSLTEALPNGLFSTPAVFNNWVFFHGQQDVLRAFAVTNGQLSTYPVSLGGDEFGYPGSVPSISANGNQNGIIWALRSDGFDLPTSGGGAEILYAYDATNLATKLYDSSQAGPRDQMGAAEKFPVPTIANGRVYAATAVGLEVFGLIGAPVIAVAPQSRSTAPGHPLVLSAKAAGSFPLTYQWFWNGNAIPGETNTYLALNNVTMQQAGAYRVEVANAFGHVSSPSAFLTVVSPTLQETGAGLVLSGPAGAALQIEASTEISPVAKWNTLTNVLITNGPLIWFDPDSSAMMQRFYRVELVTTNAVQTINSAIQSSATPVQPK